MVEKECSCWMVLDCKTAKDCPDKCGTGKTCWENTFQNNSWEKVFEKCKHCKIFQRTMTKAD